MKLPSATALSILLGIFGMANDVRADDTNKIRTIVRRGERVDLDGFLLKGKYTLFEFYADWSPACQKWMPEMEAKIKAGDDVVLRRINIRSWSSPVASQYRIRTVPHYKLYDASGRLIREYSPDGAESAVQSGSRESPSKRSRSESPRSGDSPAFSAPKVLNISPRGDRIDVAKHVVKGQYTLFEFYADW